MSETRPLPSMTQRASLCGVILAAGASTRMGQDKALLAWPPSNSDGESLLSAAIQAFLPFNDLVIVVAGKNVRDVTPVVDANGGVVVVNSEPEHGQFSSLQCGLREALKRECDAAMITLVDKPPVRVHTLEKLRLEFDFAMAKGKWAVVPEHGGRHGHPIIIGQQMMQAFLEAPSTANAREIQHQHRSRIQYVTVDDPGTTMNLNTPEDYARIASQST
jgi:molybdenum cofactor cytidylyltransferase